MDASVGLFLQKLVFYCSQLINNFQLRQYSKMAKGRPLFQSHDVIRISRGAISGASSRRRFGHLYSRGNATPIQTSDLEQPLNTNAP